MIQVCSNRFMMLDVTGREHEHLHGGHCSEHVEQRYSIRQRCIKAEHVWMVERREKGFFPLGIGSGRFAISAAYKAGILHGSFSGRTFRQGPVNVQKDAQ